MSTLIYVFDDRRHAGLALADQLRPLPDNAVVLGLPRGGIPVAYEIAVVLDRPLDVLIVRKLGVPVHPELAFGAIGEHGVIVLNEAVLAEIDIDPAAQAAVVTRERAEIEARARTYRADLAPIALTDRSAVIVDDGMATGATAAAAVAVAKGAGAQRVIVAVPVASREAHARLSALADEVVSLVVSATFNAVGWYYRDFRQVDDRHATRLLEASRRA
jgi:putative phosphoribosyl transferase